ncbi:hypothetical protein PC128_g21096 [Phytophthora cactorum]|nr:hypothetical protein PC120_g9287 [Phytophthora cactorum]KAG3043207.1 hypothetical protein PC121_g22698 [Phytophthora cactorum]KAG3160444.1 hypothetical protein PC128_g21096 [Phytophthora cactorum]KAG4045643.1 hypothetical protein PC123_g18959 [Phytophthora cactorum]
MRRSSLNSREIEATLDRVAIEWGSLRDTFIL